MPFINVEADQSSLENDRPPTHTPPHTSESGRDSVAGDETKSPSTGAANHSLSPNEPMAIVQIPIVQVKRPISNGKYRIRNRAFGESNIYWYRHPSHARVTVHFLSHPKTLLMLPFNWLGQWDITHDANGNIFIMSSDHPPSWVGADITVSKVPVPWRLIPADGNFYYLTTDLNRFSRNPRVAAAWDGLAGCVPGTMATLKEGNQWQMWEFT